MYKTIRRMWLRSLVVCRCGGGASAGRGSSLYSPRNLIVSEILFILFYLFHIITIQVRCKRQTGLALEPLNQNCGHCSYTHLCTHECLVLSCSETGLQVILSSSSTALHWRVISPIKAAPLTSLVLKPWILLKE